MRTLDEMKAARGGRCHRCGNILTSVDKDHTFCNPCWDIMLQHEYDPYYSPALHRDTCGLCGEDENAPIHVTHDCSDADRPCDNCLTRNLPDYMDEP
jgi:hypothetical protein